MGKKILVLSGSPRRGGNTDIMTGAFVEAAKMPGMTLRRYISATKIWRHAERVITARA